MCWYRSQYFATCRHGEFTLLERCDAARAKEKERQGKKERAARGEKEETESSEGERAEEDGRVASSESLTTSVYELAEARRRGHILIPRDQLQSLASKHRARPTRSRPTMAAALYPELFSQHDKEEEVSPVTNSKRKRERAKRAKEHFQAAKDTLMSDETIKRVLADIDELKAFIARQGTTGEPNLLSQDAAVGKSYSDPVKSPATLLQAAHEEEDEETGRSRGQYTPSETIDQAPALDSIHFPTLPSAAMGKAKENSDADPLGQPAGLKVSYADAANTGVKAPNEKSYPSALPRRVESKISTLSAQVPPFSSQGGISPDRPVAFLEESAAEKAETSNGKLVKKAPHFAQPTQSYNRRTDEINRTNAETEKQVAKSTGKRGSIPGEWTAGGILEKSATYSEPSRSVEKQSVVGQSLEELAGDLMLKSPAKKAYHTVSQTPSKTSSYMAPTASANQRNAATLAQTDLQIAPMTGKPWKAQGESGDKTSKNSTLHGDGKKDKMTRNSALKISPSKIRTLAGESMVKPQPKTSARGVHRFGTSLPASPTKMSLMPEVANTTARPRRASAELLNPIRNRLDRLGLLRPRVTNPVLKHDGELAEDSQSQRLGQITAEPQDPKKIVNNPVAQLMPNISEGASDDNPGHTVESTPRSCVDLRPQHSAVDQTHSEKEFLSVSKLRPTAASFYPHRASSTEPEPDWNGLVHTRTDAEWEAMPSNIRAAILRIREYKRRHEQFEAIFGPNTPTKQPLAEQIFQKLGAPKSIRWSEEDAETVEASGRYSGVGGRSAFSPRPQASLNGILPSHLKSVAEAIQQGWTIDSAHVEGRSKYGWRGGDGREITFKGSGAHAESDPNKPVKMRLFLGRAGAYSWPPPVPEQKPEKKRKNSLPDCKVMIVKEAMEAIPIGNPEFGLCHKCLPH